MIPHVVRIAAAGGIAATAALVAYHVYWARRVLRDAEKGGRL